MSSSSYKLSADQKLLFKQLYDAASGKPHTTYRFALFGEPEDFAETTKFDPLIIALSVYKKAYMIERRAVTEGMVTFSLPMSYADAYKTMAPHGEVALSAFARPMTRSTHAKVFQVASNYIVGSPKTLMTTLTASKIELHLPAKKRKVLIDGRLDRPPKKTKVVTATDDSKLTPEELERKYPGIRAVCYRHISLLKAAQEKSAPN